MSGRTRLVLPLLAVACVVAASLALLLPVGGDTAGARCGRAVAVLVGFGAATDATRLDADADLCARAARTRGLTAGGLYIAGIAVAVRAFRSGAGGDPDR